MTNFDPQGDTSSSVFTTTRGEKKLRNNHKMSNIKKKTVEEEVRKLYRSFEQRLLLRNDPNFNQVNFRIILRMLMRSEEIFFSFGETIPLTQGSAPIASLSVFSLRMAQTVNNNVVKMRGVEPSDGTAISCFLASRLWHCEVSTFSKAGRLRSANQRRPDVEKTFCKKPRPAAPLKPIYL